MNSYSIMELPEEIQMEIMLVMEPKIISNYCKTCKLYRKISTSSDFWNKYIKILNNDVLDKFMLDMAKYNQSIIIPLYKSVKNKYSLLLPTIGNLIILSLMRKDRNTTYFLLGQYNNNRADNTFYGDITHYRLAKMWDNITDLIDLLIDNIDYDSIDDIICEIDLYMVYNINFLIYIMENKLGKDILFKTMRKYSESSASTKYNRMLLSFYVSEQRIDDINSIIDIISNSDIMSKEKYQYYSIIANKLPVKLYNHIKVDNLRVYINEPIDKDHLIEASTYSNMRINILFAIIDYFKPEEYIGIINEIHPQYHAYLLNVYARFRPEIVNLYDKLRPLLL